MGDHDALTISHTLADLRVWDFSVNSLSETDVAVGCHLVNLALEEVSLDVAVRGRMAAVIVFLHESFQFIGSRDAPVVPIEFLHLALY